MPAVRQTSTQQLDHLIKFIEKNPTASGFTSQAYCHTGKTDHKAWNTLMHQLNAMEGNKKSAENWRKYWNLLKHRTKLKVIEYQKFKRSPKNFRRTPPLDSYQRRIWQILLREKNKDIHLETTETIENETEDDTLVTNDIVEEPETVETVIMDVKTCSEGQMEDLEPQNDDFQYFLVDGDNLEEGDNNSLDQNQTMQETNPLPKRESTYETQNNYVKLEVEELNSEDDVRAKKQYAKRKPHRIPKETIETNSDIEEETENSDLETQIAKLQKELLKKQILVEEQKLFQIKLQNEVLKKQLQEDIEKYAHNHMKRLLEKEELQKINLDKYSD